MTSEKPIPIIVCGRSEQIAAGVIAGLGPKYEGKLLRYSTSSAPC